MTSNSEEDSWLESRPPWSLSQSSPFRPTHTTNASIAVGVAHASKYGSPINLIAQFLRIRTAFELETIEFSVDNYGVKLGEGTTYAVEKMRPPEINAKLSEREWVAVKRSKSIIPKDPDKVIAMPYDSLRRLKHILLEIEIMFHPPVRTHPNIIQLLGFSWDRDAPGYAPLLVMEFASHGTLAEFLSTETTTNLERRQLCLDVALGLEVLHSSMIVHGDVKQDNVLVFAHPSRRFIAKLSDFGLALLSDDELVYRGTPIYNAPEVHLQSPRDNRHESSVSQDRSSDLLIKCDAFSFGLLCFEIFMSGQRYYELPLTRLFREMLFAGAPDNALFMDQAIELSHSALVPNQLTTDCRSIFENTLAPSPTSRLQNGWDVVKEIFGMRPAAEPEERRNVAQSLYKFTREKPSMLEFHYTEGLAGEVLESIISELRFFAESSESHEERAQASFNMCLLSAISKGTGILGEDAALDWLKKAQFHGHEMAHLLGPRIFGACQTPILHHISVNISEDTAIDEDESKISATTWYADAVRVHWGKSIRAKLIHDLQQQLFHERPIITRLNERLVECFQNMQSFQSTESHFLLHLAIACGNLEILQSLLDRGVDVNARTPSGTTALHVASMVGSLDILRLLVQQGADASINDDKNTSPIHWLVLFPSNDIDEAADVLVRAKANLKSCVVGVYSYDELGLLLRGGPIHWALLCRNHSAVLALLRQCEKLGYTNSDCLLREDETRWSAVDTALGTVCADTLEIILQHHSLLNEMSVYEKEMCWRTVASPASNNFQRWCIHGDNYETAFTDVMAVLHHCGIEYNDDFGDTTPLINAAISCNYAWAKALIQDGVHINYRPLNNTGTAMETAIFYAAHSTDIFEVIKFVKLLFDSGGSMEPVPFHPSGEDKVGRAEAFRLGALHMAVKYGADLPLVQYLLQQIPEQLNKIYYGDPILSGVLTWRKDTDACRIISLLLAAGVDLNAETNHTGHDWGCCYTVACFALSLESWRVLKLLLDHDITLKFGVSGGHERSILHYALFLSFKAEYVASMDDKHHRRPRLELIELVLSHPISARNNLVNQLTFNGGSPLMYAATWGLPAHVNTLLKHGADIHYQWQGDSVFDMIDKLRNEEIEIPWVTDDEDVFALERFEPLVKRSEYFRRLDEIKSLLQHHVALN